MNSFGATLLGPVVTILVQLVNVPVMLHCWGPKLYGEWLVLTALPTYLMLTDMGFGNVAGAEMTMRVNAGDRAGALEMFQSTIALVLLATLAMLALVIAAFLFLPLPATVSHSSFTAPEARLTLLLLLVNCLVLVQWSVLMAGYRASGRYATGALYVNLTRIAEASCFLLLLFAKARPVHLAALMLLVSIGGTGLLLWEHQRNVPWLPCGLAHAQPSRIRSLTRPALSYMAFPACAALGTQGMTLVIGVLLGPLAVAVFNPLRTLTRTILQLTDTVKSSVSTELSAAFGSRNLPLARRLHHAGLQVSLLLATLAAVALATTGPGIFTFWTHGYLPFNGTVFYLLLATALVNSTWNTSSSVILSSNRHGPLSLVYISLSLLSVGLTCALLGPLGLKGAAIAMLVLDVGMSFTVLYLSSRMLDDSVKAILSGLRNLAALRTLAKSVLARVRRFWSARHSVAPENVGHILGHGTQNRTSTRSIPSLDGLRGVSILMVVLSHLNGWSRLPRHGAWHLLLVTLGQGGLGVTVFFVISGFLITTLLLEERERTGGIHLRRFYFRRTLRIFPPYYLYLAVATTVAILAHRPMPRSSVLSSLLYAANYFPYLRSHPEGVGWYLAHTWSLSVEEQFYLLWPLLLLRVAKTRAMQTCVAVLLVVPVLRLLTVLWLPIYATSLQWFRLFHTTADLLVLGGLLAFLLRSVAFREGVQRLFHPLLLTAAGLWLLCSSAMQVHAPLWFSALFGVSLTGISVSLLLLWVVLQPRTFAGKVLNTPVLRHVGVISYSLYLWQQLFLGPFWAPSGVANVAAAFACAELSFWLVERPSHRMRGRLEKAIQRAWTTLMIADPLIRGEGRPSQRGPHTLPPRSPACNVPEIASMQPLP